MFRLRLSFAFAVLVALVCCQTAFVYWGSNRVNEYAAHSRLTSDILSELLEISANKQRLRVWASQRLMNAEATSAVRDQLLERMRTGAGRLDAMSRLHLDSWRKVSSREDIAVPQEVFQLVEISKLMVGYNDNTSIQAVELRMIALAENHVVGASIAVYDAAGDFVGNLGTFPGDVPNGAVSDRLLCATAAFRDAFSITPDLLIAAGLLTETGQVSFEKAECLVNSLAYGNVDLPLTGFTVAISEGALALSQFA